MARKKGYDKKIDSAYARGEASRYTILPNQTYLSSAEESDAVASYGEPGMDPNMADAIFDDWLPDIDEGLPLQAEAAALPGPSAEVKKQKSPKLCKKCFGAFLTGGHKNCSKKTRYNNLLQHLSPEGKAKLTGNLVDDAFKGSKVAVNLTNQFGKKMQVTTVSNAGKN